MKRGHNSELIYHTKNSFTFYIFPTLLLVAILFCLFFDVQIFVTIFLCFILLTSIFQERYNIIVFSDRFILREDFLPGNLMRIDKVFYYEDVKSFSFDTNIWKPKLKDWIGLAAVALMLSLRHNRPKKREKIFLKIKYLNVNRELVEEEIIFPIQENNFLKVTEMIEKRCSKK